MFRVLFLSGVLALSGAFVAKASECTESQERVEWAEQAQLFFQQRSGGETGLANAEAAAEIYKALFEAVQMCENGDLSDVITGTSWWVSYLETAFSIILFGGVKPHVKPMKEMLDTTMWLNSSLEELLAEEELTPEQRSHTEQLSSKLLYFGGLSSHYALLYLMSLGKEKEDEFKELLTTQSDILSTLQNSRHPDVYHNGLLRLRVMDNILQEGVINSETEALIEVLFTSTGGEYGVTYSAHEQNNLLYLSAVAFRLTHASSQEEIKEDVAFIENFAKTPANEITSDRIPEMQFIQQSFATVTDNR